MIDTSVVRVHRHGACIADNSHQDMGRSRGGLTSKIHAVVDANGLPVHLALTPGEAHDNRLCSVLPSASLPQTVSKWRIGALVEPEVPCRSRHMSNRQRIRVRSRAIVDYDGLVSGRPGLVVAGGRWPTAAGQRRAGGAIGRRRPRHVRDMRFFPFARRIVFFGRRDIDGVVQPAIP